MTLSLGESHYGRGTVVTGSALLLLAFIYMAQVAVVLLEVREVVAVGGRQAELLHFRIYDFFVTREGWLGAHVWLLWVVLVQLVRRPQRRLRLVRSLGAATMLVIGITWALVRSVHRLGPSV